jgi:hypothetical protein
MRLELVLFTAASDNRRAAQEKSVVQRELPAATRRDQSRLIGARDGRDGAVTIHPGGPESCRIVLAGEGDARGTVVSPSV